MDGIEVVLVAELVFVLAVVLTAELVFALDVVLVAELVPLPDVVLEVGVEDVVELFVCMVLVDERRVEVTRPEWNLDELV